MARPALPPLSLAAAVCLGALSALSPNVARAEEPKEPAAEPSSPIAFTIEPLEEGRWRMALENTGDAPLRVLSDARYVWLEVVTAPVVPEEGAKKKPKPKAYPKGKIPLCRAPSDLRPSLASSDRWVTLKKGERVVEHFDPVLLCGATGTSDGMSRGAVIYPHFGTPPDAAMLRAIKQKKPVKPKGPFVVEPASASATGPFLRDLEATTFAIPYELAGFSPESFAAGGGPGRPGDDVDERAPRVQITANGRGDAATETDVSVRVTTKNVGLRPAMVHLRPDDFSFAIAPPSGPSTQCGPGPAQRGAARDFFVNLAPGASRTTTLLLRELCPGRTFSQPGVYRILPRLELRETGNEYNLTAFTASAPAPNPTRVRVRAGRLPFHVAPPLVRKQGEPDEPPPPPPPKPAVKEDETGEAKHGDGAHEDGRDRPAEGPKDKTEGKAEDPRKDGRDRPDGGKSP